MLQTEIPLTELYERDETAWLDAMVELLRSGDLALLDYQNLTEFLNDMAIRDRREIESRLRVLLAHVLKWIHQPEYRSRSWRSTIIEQKFQLGSAAGEGVLRNHAENVLPKAYDKAVQMAAEETELPPETFPAECPFTFDALLNFVPGPIQES